MHKLSFLIIFFLTSNIQAQQIKIVSSEAKSSFRGLSVVDNKTVWVSGSNGIVGKSIDSGITWKFMTVKGFEKTDFRDIEAFDEKTAIIMGIDCPARILKTTNGGETWTIMFEDTTKGMFLDAMEFQNENSGVVIGDPIGGKAFIAKLSENVWKPNPIERRPNLDSGEAFFASSGTNIRILDKHDMVAISGGVLSNLLIDNKKIKLPLLQGKESTGANSIAVKDANTFMIVGGDFLSKDSITGNYCFTKDRGKTWIPTKHPPSGYRSCVEFLERSNWVTCGLNGVDVTEDDGMHFRKFSEESFNTCRKAKNGNAVYFAGGKGKIGKLIY
ncbi:MAG: oxidoreductase [Bacteroidota bacterium]